MKNINVYLHDKKLNTLDHDKKLTAVSCDMIPGTALYKLTLEDVAKIQAFLPADYKQYKVLYKDDQGEYYEAFFGPDGAYIELCMI